MNKWKVRSVKLTYVPIYKLPHRKWITIIRFNQFAIADKKEYSYYSKDITPSSLSRLMRVMQGKPMFGETCRWNKINTTRGDWFLEPICSPNIRCYKYDYTYCPYCGKRIEVSE